MAHIAGFYVERWIVHVGTSFLVGVLLFFLLNLSRETFIPFITIAMVTSMVPDLDAHLGIGHRNPILHSFLVPLLFALVFPHNLFVTAFLAGYTSHTIADLERPEQAWTLVQQRTGVMILWVSLVVLLMLIFGIGAPGALKILNY